MANAFFYNGQEVTLEAGADLTNAPLGSALVVGANDEQVVLASSDNQQVVGFLVTRPDSAVAGSPVSVLVSGVVTAIADGAVALASHVTSGDTTDGRVDVPQSVTAASANARCGIALEAAAAAGDLFLMRIV